MLFLTASLSRSPRAPDVGGATDGSVHRLERGAASVEVRTGPLFGFCRTVGDRLVAGESISPPGREEAASLEAAVARDAPLETLVEDPFLMLVVADLSSRTVVIASSIASQRPCYYMTAPGLVMVSTSIAALREAGLRPTWDPACTAEMLAYRFVVPPRTIVHGVRKLAGGQTITVDLVSGRVLDDRRWQFPPVRAGIDSGKEVEGSLSARVGDWLRRVASAAVLLSGGLDSSLVTAIGARTRPDISTYSTGFSFLDPDDREKEYAVSMARECGVRHEVYEGSPEAYLAGWVESLVAAEEPAHHLQTVMIHLLIRERIAARHGAVLSGEGADALFGTDSHEVLFAHRRLVAALRATHVGALFAPLGRMLGLTGWRWSMLSAEYGADWDSPRHFLWTLGRYGDAGSIRRILGCEESALIGGRQDLMAPYREQPLLSQVTALSFLGGASATMVIWGKIAEAAGVRLACPFASPAVIRAATAAPWDLKLREGKHLVRAALRRAGISEALITRPKLSFGFSIKYWAPKGKLFQPVVDMAAETFGRETLESLQQDEVGSSMVLWGLLNQYLWRQLFEFGRPAGDLIGEILDRRKTLQLSA